LRFFFRREVEVMGLGVLSVRAGWLVSVRVMEEVAWHGFR